MSAPATGNRLSRLRLVGFDVDGVFTDGRFYLSDDGVESKAFCTQDGFGIRALLAAGVEVAVISGRRSGAVAARMRELGVRHVFLHCADKVGAFTGLAEELGVELADCAFVGDDVPDLALLERVGYSVAVANAAALVREQCDYTTQAAGGYGAVREVCDLVLAARPGADA
ncbi:MAG: HAD hydrolase family protein [Woeseiaceae bacterium]|nr:HAD hydrolase family protein [Woeseiaceae bacterium]